MDRNSLGDTRFKHHKKQKTSFTGKLEDGPKFRLDEKKKIKHLTGERTKYDQKTPRSAIKRTSQSDRSNEKSSSSKERTMKSDECKNASSERSTEKTGKSDWSNEKSSSSKERTMKSDEWKNASSERSIEKTGKSVWSNEGNYSSNKSSGSNGTERGIKQSERMNWSHEKKMKIEDQRSNRWNFKGMSIENKFDQQSEVSEISKTETDFLKRHRTGDKQVPYTSNTEYECTGERGEGRMKKVEPREKTSFQTISRSSKSR